MGHLINRRTKVLSEEDIQTIADTNHLWKKGEKVVSEENKTIEEWQTMLAAEDGVGYEKENSLKYEDVPGFCKSERMERIAELDYVLTPGQYVGLPEEEERTGRKLRPLINRHELWGTN